MGGAVISVLRGQDHDSLKKSEKGINHAIENSTNLILCLNAASLCKMVYKNSIRNNKYFKYEHDNLKNLDIKDYKIWTYVDYAELVLDTIRHKPAVSAQCTTGIISHLNSDYPDNVPFICFGGTISLYEVIADLSSIIHTQAKTLRGEIIGTSGYGMVNVYHTLRAFGLVDFIVGLMKKHNSGLLVTGHSIGGAVALLFVCELMMDYPDLFDQNPVSLITFGSPRVFTRESAHKIYSIMKKKPLFKFIRVVNESDIISMLPPAKSGSLVHIGDAFYFSKRDIQVHSGEAHVNFPPDGDGFLHEMRNFLLDKAGSHVMDSDHGYIPRMIVLSSTLKKIDADHMPILEALTKSITKHSLHSVKNYVAGAKLRRIEHSFIHHFFAKPELNVECKIWNKLTDPHFDYPENTLDAVSNKSDFGIALSGGGLAGACFTLGWLRALNLLGILKKAKYISSVSSAAWVHVPMTFNPNQQPLKTFFGPYFPPEDCTISKVEYSVFEGQGRILANNDIIAEMFEEELEHIPTHLFHHSREIDIWSETVGKAYLQPHGFEIKHAAVPAVYGDHADRIKHVTSGWLDAIHTTRPMKDHPYPIINAAVFVGSDRGCVPVEFTPMYFGIPPYYDNGHHGIGGCLIEPHGFTGKPDPFEMTEQMLSNTQGGACSSTLTIPRPQFALTIQEVLGIASSNMSTNKSNSKTGVSYDSNYYPILPTFTSECPGDHIASREQFVDGSNCDYTGIISLLRRRCSFIIACITASDDIKSLESTVADSNVHSLGGLAALFGRHVSERRVDGVKNDSFNRQRQVFASDGWDELLSALRLKRKGRKKVAFFQSLIIYPSFHFDSCIF